MRTFTIDRFLGLDTRPGRYGEDYPALVTASNVALKSGGAISRRPALRTVASLSSESVGLYARGGRLRSVVPGGQSLQGTGPTEVTYDPIGDGTAYPLGVLSRLVDAESYGTHHVFGPHGYVAVKRTNGAIEHHWIKEPPVSAATAVSTKVDLPFIAGEALLKLAEKMWAPSPVDGTVPFSASSVGPSDWSLVGDAGALPAQSHVSGARDMVALTHYRGRLAVFFPDAVQLWNVDPDPELHALEQVLNGPGAILAGSVANVLGDVIYLSRGGFRTLSSATVTGEAAENDIGSKIRTLTDLIGTTTPAARVWSQTRSQFLCAIGTTVYVLTLIPGEKMAEWTTWTLPVAADYLVENEGALYLRGGNTLYRLDDTESQDTGGAAITGTIETRPLALGAPGKFKTVHYLVIRQTAAASWQLIVDGQAMTAKNVPACSPKALRIPFNGEGRQIAFRVTTTADWRLEGLSVEFDVQGM